MNPPASSSVLHATSEWKPNNSSLFQAAAAVAPPAVTSSPSLLQSSVVELHNSNLSPHGLSNSKLQLRAAAAAATEEEMKPGQIAVDFGRDSKGKKNDSKSVTIFCFDISKLSRRAQFLILSCSVFSFYLVYGYMQEWIFRQEGMKPHGW